MKLKPKGRKIYRQKSRSERWRAFRSNTGAVLLTLLLVGGLGFVGFSAGGPILHFLQERRLITEPSEALQMQTETTAEQTETQDNTVSDTTEETPPTQPITEPVPPQAPKICGYQLSAAALFNQASLDAAIAEVPAGTTHILIPLKTKGGSLYYATALEDVSRSNAVQAVMPLTDIYETVRKQGIEPVAVINTLEDNIYPMNYQAAAYCVAGSGARWIDGNGKACMSPFSPLTLDYLANLTAEIHDAGFTSFVCEGLLFPTFSKADLEKLDPMCNAPDRYTALVDVVNAMQKAAPDAEFYVRIEGSDVLMNKTDALFAAEQLELEAVLITVNSVTQANTDLLRHITYVHPCILEWTDISVPADEKIYIQHAEDAEPKMTETTES